MAPDASGSSSKGAGQSANPTLSSSTSSNTEPLPREEYAKKGWGSRINFQLSYGLKPCNLISLLSSHHFLIWSDAANLEADNSDDWKEGNRILDAMIKADMEEHEGWPGQGIVVTRCRSAEVAIGVEPLSRLI